MARSKMSKEIALRAIALCKSLKDDTYNAGAIAVCRQLWQAYGDAAIETIEQSSVRWFDIYVLAQALNNDSEAIINSIRDGSAVDILKARPDSTYNFFSE